VCSSGRNESEPHNAQFSLGSQPRALRRLSQLGQAAGGFPLKGRARRSLNSSSSGPLDESHPELLFESLNLQAQGWLAEMNDLSRTTEVQSLRQ